jgi:hypothetical protein
MERAPMLMDR